MAAYRSRAALGEVSAADLARLPEIHALLVALDDPAAALPRIAALCEQLPPLAHRIVELARQRQDYSRAMDLHRALALVGNRGVEKVLLQLLEDLTILKADLDERA